MHRIFSGDGWLVFPDILKSARDHRPSQRLLQQPPVLIILCILCIDVQFIVLLDGSAQSRGAGARLAGKREFPKGDRPAFREVACPIPPPHHRDDTPGSAGVPPACCPFGCRSVSLRCCSRPPCRREPHGPGRSRGRAPLPVDSGGGDGRSCGRICAGGTPALPGGLSPMTGSHQRDKSDRSILAPVVVEGGPSVLVTETKPVSLSYDPPRRRGRGPDLPDSLAGYKTCSRSNV